MRTFAGFSLLLWVGLSTVACGDDESDGAGGTGGVSSGGGGSTANGGEGGSGGNSSEPVALTSVVAPTEFSVVLQLQGEFIAGHPQQPSMYALTSLNGDLEVLSVSFDAAANTITLETSKQKLGVEYTLTVKAPGNELDFKFQAFLSADTATFWAVDFADFSNYQVTARRERVGEHVVVYATPEAEDADDLDQTVAYFDETIFPIETAELTAAPDRDGNGKVLLLGLNGNQYYGGYFSPVDSITDAEAMQFGGHSNEMEMLYVSVPDNGNKFLPIQVVAHEFSHLLYNEVHDFSQTDWNWHNEGMAECAVHLVTGMQNEYATDTYFAPNTPLAAGQSLVQWEYANYYQYAQAYMFLAYSASRLGGVDSFGDLFALEGSPASLEAVFQAEFSRSFSETQLDFLTAAWLDEPSGPYGFSGLVSPPNQPPTLPLIPGSLPPFTGVFVGVSQTMASPVGAGPDVVHRGVSGAGSVDDVAPFDSSGGTLIALNTDSTLNATPQSTGTFSLAAAASVAEASADAGLWLHPPPIKPANREQMLKWRKRVHGH